MNDIISVIVPVYKVEKYLDRCVESIVNQTYKNLEIILVDDGSLDNCPQMCDEWAKNDNRIRVIHKQNGGLSDARNAGIETANGQYITFVDSDDWLDLDCVEYLYTLVKKYGTNLSTCQMRQMKDGNIRAEFGYCGDCLKTCEGELKDILYGRDQISTWGKLYSKNVFDNVRFPKDKIYEDVATTYKCVMQCDSVAVGNESKYNYRITPDSILTSNFRMEKYVLLEFTDLMAKEVVSVYPNLCKATERRKVFARFSLLNQMKNVTGMEKEKNELIGYILDKKLKVLRDISAPSRDKIAVLSLLCGYGFYKWVWDVFCKLYK